MTFVHFTHVAETGYSINQSRVADPDLLMGAIRGAELDPWLLSGHGKESWLSRLDLGGSCLEQAEFGPSAWFRGVMPKDCYTMIFVTACPEEGHSFNFNTKHRDECLGFFAPGEVLDAKTPEGYRHGTLTISETFFIEAVESKYPELSDRILKKGRSYFPDSKICSGVSGFLTQLTLVIDRHPDVLDNDIARNAMESELHDHFFGLIRPRHGKGEGMDLHKISQRYLRMRLIRDFIRDHRQRPIRLKELCEVSGLSRRGLEYLFLDVLGVRVGDFLLQTRLHGVRRELLTSVASDYLVKSSALNWGFWHLGRFAAQYQACFGELPSATLAQRR